MVQRVLFFVACILILARIASGQANGKLQIHHMDVGQGDGAILISPGGQVVVFDVGEDTKKHDCTKPVSYLDQLGIKHVDYLYVSHYHFDHIGCIPTVLSEIPLQGDAYDRGESYSGTTYDNYIASVGTHRKTAKIGDVITLDGDSQNPVVITVVALNGKSKHG